MFGEYLYIVLGGRGPDDSRGAFKIYTGKRIVLFYNL